MAQRANLIDRLDRLGAAVREEAAVPVVRHAPDERLGQEPRERLALHLDEVRQRRGHRVAQRLLDRRMTAPEREHAEPGEEVEIALALAIEQVRTLGPHVVAVEADRAQHAWHLRIHVALVQRERLGAARLAGARRRRRCSVRARRRVPHPVAECAPRAPASRSRARGTTRRPRRGRRGPACSCSRARCAPACRRIPCASSPSERAPPTAWARGGAHGTRTTRRRARSAGRHGDRAGRAARAGPSRRRAVRASAGASCSRRPST